MNSLGSSRMKARGAAAGPPLTDRDANLKTAILIRPFLKARPSELLPGVDLVQQVGGTVKQHEELHQREGGLGLAVLVTQKGKTPPATASTPITLSPSTKTRPNSAPSPPSSSTPTSPTPIPSKSPWF